MLRLTSANSARGSRRDLGEDGGATERCKVLKHSERTNKTYFLGSAAGSLKRRKKGMREVTPVMLRPLFVPENVRAGSFNRQTEVCDASALCCNFTGGAKEGVGKKAENAAGQKGRELEGE